MATIERIFLLGAASADARASACALVRYEVRPPNGAPPFESHVAEFFTVEDGQIGAFAICFDAAPYPKS